MADGGVVPVLVRLPAQEREAVATDDDDDDDDGGGAASLRQHPVGGCAHESSRLGRRER